jgi:hypothetical protein
LLQHGILLQNEAFLPNLKVTDMFALSDDLKNLTHISSVMPRVVYTRARKDRSGAVIHNMLLAHAYAFAQNYTTIYGGACVSNTSKWTVQEMQTRHSELLQGLRLDRMLPFVDCPTPSSSIVPREVYRPRHNILHKKVRLWTPEWLAYVQSQMNISNKSKPPEKEDTFVIAVHVRRGDIEPCRANFGARYLPNQHYLQLIQAYLPPLSSQKTTQVVIYSQSKSTEPWEDFLQYNYTLALDTNVLDVWKGIMMADVVILSRSTFSFVPAALNVYQNHGTIVYTPDRHPPLPHWHVVNSTIMDESQRVMNRMYDGCSMVSSVKQQQLKNAWGAGDKIPKNAPL